MTTVDTAGLDEPVPDLSGSSARPAAAPAPDRRRTLATWLALAAVVGIGTAIRAHGLTSLGLWRDDAWVALSSRVGIGTAWHMWVTAPGFYLLERSFVLLHPGVTWWAQLPPLVVGAAAIPAMYVVARFFRLSRLAGLGLAVLVCASPIAIDYSTRLKEYGADFLLTCLLLTLGEAARRQPDRRHLMLLALASVACFAVSATMGLVVVALWTALLVLHRGSRPVLAAIVAAGGCAAIACAVVAGLLYRHVSPALQRFWEGYYLHHASAWVFTTSLYDSTWNVMSGLLGLTVVQPAARVVVLAGLVAFLVAGAWRIAAMLGPVLVLAAAVVASALHLVPLGAGRVDEYLYPVLLLLLGVGVTRAWRVLDRELERARRGPALPLSRVAAVVVLLGGVALLGDASRDLPVYPGTNVQALAAAIRHDARPGDHVVVGELMRYPWALYEDRPPHLVFGSNWSTGFTVVSTRPDTFIVPSEGYEGGSDPALWARQLRPYRRLWYVYAPPRRSNPSYAALVAAGWRPRTTISAAGGDAVLLQRPG
jgi:hypothetical protein